MLKFNFEVSLPSTSSSTEVIETLLIFVSFLFPWRNQWRQQELHKSCSLCANTPQQLEHVSKSEAGESKWNICAVGIRERVAIVGRGILFWAETLFEMFFAISSSSCCSSAAIFACSSYNLLVGGVSSAVLLSLLSSAAPSFCCRVFGGIS